MITTAANGLAAPIHVRMPVLLEGDDRLRWLDPTFQDVPALAELLKHHDADDLEAYPVSTYVNKPAHSGAQCIERLAEI